MSKKEMTFVECMCVAKIYAVAAGLAARNSITNYEVDIAAEALKQLADEQLYWTKEQKDMYKLLVDIVKHS